MKPLVPRRAAGLCVHLRVAELSASTAERRGPSCSPSAVRALLEVCLSPLVIPDFFIELFLKPASREPVEGSYDFFFLKYCCYLRELKGKCQAD